MIKSIEIFNFLSHKKSKMVFGKEVNAIVGATDSGKSAIIIRIKSDIENKYIVCSKHNGSKLVFKGFGTTVPIEVQNILNITKTNLQTQSDPYFLLSNSAGEVSSYFNSMAHLDKIDIGRKNTTSWMREIESLINADKSELKRLKGELVAYADIHIIEDKLTSIEAINAQLILTIKSQDELNNYISDLKKIDKKIKEGLGILSAEKLVNEVILYQAEIDLLLIEINDLKEFISDLRFINFGINQAEKFIAAEKLVDSLIKIQEECAVLSNDYLELEASRNYLLMFIKKENILESELKIMQKMFDDNMGEFCILCGFKLKKNKS